MLYIESRFRSLFATLLANFILFGVSLTIIGATLPKIIRGFQWSYTATGVVLSAGSIGYFVSTFLSGIFVQKFGPKRIVVTGLVLQAVGLSFFATRPIVLFNMLVTFMIGLGQGGTEVVTNFSVIRIERSGQSRLMNLMHAAFSVGAIIGPFVVGKLIGAGIDWRMIYRFLALVALLMAGALSLLPFSRLGRESAKSEEQPRIVGFLGQPLIILFFLILLLYVGTEMGVSSWVAEYYVKILGTSASVGAFMVSVFWIGILIGRLGVSFGFRGSRQVELLFVLASTCTVALFFSVLVKGPYLAAIGFALTGLGYSAIYPVVMALVGQYFKRGQSIAIGFVSTGGGVGSFVFPFLMAAIADRFGMRRAFSFYIALDVIMIVLTCAVIWQTRIIQKRKASKISKEKSSES